MKKRSLAIDIDDVLCYYTPILLKWHNQEYETKYQLSDIKEFDLTSLFGCDRDEMSEKIDRFSQTEEYKHLPLINNAQESLLKLSNVYDLYLVTARMPSCDKSTQEWINKYFSPDLKNNIKQIIYCDGRTKKEICCEINAFALVDDSPKNLTTFDHGNANDKCILILFNLDNNYGWSKSFENNTHMLICQSWDEVVEFLMK